VILAAPRPVTTPDRLERKRAEARAAWAKWMREKELRERLALHRELALGVQST
jgi:hypothetical protein